VDRYTSKERKSTKKNMGKIIIETVLACEEYAQ